MKTSYLTPTEELLANNYTSSFKVLCTRTRSGHIGQTSNNGTYKVISCIKVLEPNEICTDTYLVLGCFNRKEDAEALFSYLSTTFVRYLLLQAISSINLTRDCFRFVPMQDFSSNSDLDWTLPVEKLDQQLFAKYGLTPEECEEITSTIIPM